MRRQIHHEKTSSFVPVLINATQKYTIRHLTEVMRATPHSAPITG